MTTDSWEFDKLPEGPPEGPPPVPDTPRDVTSVTQALPATPPSATSASATTPLNPAAVSSTSPMPDGGFGPQPGSSSAPGLDQSAAFLNEDAPGGPPAVAAPFSRPASPAAAPAPSVPSASSIPPSAASAAPSAGYVPTAPPNAAASAPSAFAPPGTISTPAAAYPAPVSPASAPAVGAAGLGAAPVGPPPRYRPDTTPGRTGATIAPVEVAQPSTPALESGATMSASPGWGWRALVAFVAGGLLTGGGFAIGQLAIDGSDSEVDAGAAVTTSVPVETTTPPTTAAPRIVAAGEEPALVVADALGPSVVQIETDFGIGSGVIYADGLIITNHHVVDGATRLIVQLKDGRRIPGQVLGSEPNVDIAVVSVGEGQGLPVAPLATGERARVGQIAIAIGSPFRLQQTVTEGIVSAVDRPVPTGSVYTAMIQTDAPINPGNSGGALADSQGRVIGINTAIQTDGNSNTNAGIGFAIPIDTAVSVADRLAAGLPIEAGFLGVAGDQSLDGSAGVEVTNVTDGSSADLAGILVGDLIISIDGAPVTAFEELAGLVVARSPGDVVVLEMVRDGQPLTVEATLGAREG